jgi:hypothetical protein
MKPLSIYLAALLFLQACSGSEKPVSTNISNQDSVPTYSYYGEKDKLYSSISISNDTIDVFAEKYLGEISMSSPFHCFDSVKLMDGFIINSYPIDTVNFDDNTATDTIYTAIKHTDTLIFAKANSGIFLWKMRANTDEIKIDTNIYISCSKKAINDMFSVDIRKENFSFIISSPGDYYHYTIKDGTIVKLVYEVDFEGVN